MDEGTWFDNPVVQGQLWPATLETLDGLTATDLERLVDDPYRVPIGVRLVSIINDITQHLGQIGYLRGLVRG